MLSFYEYNKHCENISLSIYLLYFLNKKSKCKIIIKFLLDFLYNIINIFFDNANINLNQYIFMINVF